jgi:hypothetical protein
MSKPLISGILGLIAVVIGLAGITQSWMDHKVAYVIIDCLTGTDLLGAPLTSDNSGIGAVLILIGLIGGAATSVLCFIKEGETARVFFFLTFFAVIFGFMMVTDDIGSMYYSHGTGTTTGIGIWMEMIAAILLFIAIMCPDPKRSAKTA